MELLVLLQLVARGLVSGGRSLLLGQLGIEWLGLVLGLGLTALMKCLRLLPGGVLLDGSGVLMLLPVAVLLPGSGLLMLLPGGLLLLGGGDELELPSARVKLQWVRSGSPDWPWRHSHFPDVCAIGCSFFRGLSLAL